MAREFDDPDHQVIGQPDTQVSEDQTAARVAATTRVEALAAFDLLGDHPQGDVVRTYGIGAFPAYGSFYKMHYSDGYFVGEDFVAVDRFEGSTYNGRTTPASETYNGPKYDLQVAIGRIDDEGGFKTPFGEPYTPSFVFGVKGTDVFVTKYTVEDGQLIAGPELALPQISAQAVRLVTDGLHVASSNKPMVDRQRQPYTTAG